ncbi:MAG: DNA mismatch repair endonuclease MutL, partial [Kiritimatiellia bacterium]
MLEPHPVDTPAQIRVLPDTVINQIAAGEVVERPASVLKELVENSLDAGARRIEVDVVDGGRRLVRVRDDGAGMDHDNALLALERHATSKLRALQDLDHIATMGFRGEALAAIASVAQFTLLTNRAGSATGTEILVFGGRIQEVRDAGVPPGTDIAVRNLFFNVPARRKFLRSAPTEFTHIRQAFIHEALANPSVEFILRADDADVYRLPAGTLLDRIRDLYGAEMAAHLRPLNFGNGSVEISGYAGVPPFSRLDREWQIVFINERPTSSPVVSFAIQSAYRDVLVGGRYAPLFMQVRVPSDAVDVNVHPAKKEVRFHRPTEVRDVIIEAIRLAISGGEMPKGKRSAAAPHRAE